MQALPKTKSFGVIEKPLVKYRQYATSVSGQYSLKSMKSHVSVLYKCQKHYHESGFSEYNKKRIINKLANKQIAILAHVGHLPYHEKQEFFSLFKQDSKYLKYSSGKFKYVYMMSRIIGYQRISKIVGRKR